jgi:uncharacterized membrane protein YgcG
MRRLLQLAACFAFTAASLASLPASAAITVGQVVEWSTGNDREVLGVKKMNLRDCRADATLTLATPNVDSVSGANRYEVWAGNGCEQEDNRQGATRECVLVAQPNLTDDEVTVRVQDLVLPKGGTAPGTIADCEVESGSSGETSRALHFLVLSSSDVVVNSGKWDYSFDITPPGPPTEVQATPGENALNVDFEASPAADKNGYRLYCSRPGEPAPDQASGAGGGSAQDEGGTSGSDSSAGGSGGTAGTGGTGATSGASGDGGAAGGGGAAARVRASRSALNGTCTSSVLTPGSVPEEMYECGEVRAETATSARTRSDLDNGVEYVVGVAAVDKYDNTGTLSELACGTPTEVTGFYEAYRQAGGSAGGGFCGFGAPARGGHWAALGFAVAVTVARARRRK